MCGGSPDVDNSALNFQKKQSRQARAEETKRNARIAKGMTAIDRRFSGLDGVLDQRRSAMEGFYIPQLDKRREDASDEQKFALARAGLGVSTTASKRASDLAESFGLERAAIDSRIQGDVANTQTRMNQQRSALEAALRASGDASAASNASLAAASTFRAETPELNPLGELFATAAQGIGAIRQGQEYGRIAQLSTPRPLNSGTGRVVS